MTDTHTGEAPMSDNPQPCPFCGSAEGRAQQVRSWRWAVFCGGCGAEGPNGADEATATAAWNQRETRADER
jgi:Lar family restriction alleviation protein